MADYLVEIRNKNSWQQPIKDKDLTAPAGGESKGDRFIVAATASGLWSGHEDDIAQYTGSGWNFLTPAEGWICWIEDEDTYYRFNGASWAEFAGGGSGGGNSNYEGTIDCSTNPNYPAADTGDFYLVSVAGKIGGNSGKNVDINTIIRCISTSASGDEATVGTNWRISGGDMRRSVYDTDEDGIVDEAEAVNDGVNYATAEDIVDDIALGHTQNTDTKLDEGGANEITAAQAKTAYTHSQGNGSDHADVASNTSHRGTTSGNPHNVSKSDVGLGNVPNLDTTSAINKSHDQNTDTGTNQNDFGIGDGNDTDKTITIENGDTNKPKLRYNATTSKWQYTHDGSTWYDFGTAAGSGDMLKATYDQDDDGIIDEAEAINDGTYSATAEEIEGAVDDSHTHSNKSLLDTYTQSNTDLADAVSKKHTQNTDTGTNQNSFNIGDGTDSTKEIIANNADANKPKLRYNHSTNTWQLSNDGINFEDIEAGTGSGDMLKSTYDTDDDGIVDKAETIDDGAGNSKTAAQVKTHIDSTSNPHSIDKTDVGLSNVPNLNTTDAVNKAHNRQHALNSTNDHTSSITEDNLIDADSNGLPADSGIATTDVSDAVSKKHTQNTDTGTNQNDFAIGDGADTTKTITANNGDVNKPKIKYNTSANAWQYTDDGVNWYNFGVTSGGEGSGDMTKATYDTDDDGIVDKAESIDDGTYSATAEEIEGAVDDSHTHSNKSELDLISDGDHDARTDNPHGVDKTDVGLSNVPNLDTTNAVNKAHDRQHALNSTSDHTSSIIENNLIDADANGLPADSGLSVSNVSDAVSKKHTQNTDTGTSEDDFAIGDGTDTDKIITANNGDTNKPKLRYNSSTNKWQYTNDGTNWNDIGSGTGGGDSDAIHDNVASEISAISEKTTPVNADLIIIEDSANSYNKKKVQIGNLPGGSGSAVSQEDLNLVKDNIVLNAFRIAINGSLSQFNMLDGIVDEYEDESGIDTTSSTNEYYNDIDDYYYNTEPGGIDEDTVLMLHCDGKDTSKSHILTLYNTAQLDTAQKKFGDSSLLLDGNSDYITVPDSDDWYFDTGDFTMDLWVRFNSVSGEQWFLNQYSASNPNWGFRFMPSTGLVFSAYGTSSYVANYSCSFSPSVDTWYHLALVRNGSNMYIFINGTSQTLTETNAIGSNSILNISNPLYIGVQHFSGGTRYYLNGWMDEIRISKGIARWTSNFTPSTEKYDSDEYTTLLLHFDGTDGQTTNVIDSSGGDVSDSQHVITYNGTAQLDTAQYKFNNSSLLLDGDSDYLSIADSSDFEFGSGDFTMDLWVRFNDFPDTATFISKYKTTGGRSFCWRYAKSVNLLAFIFGNNTADGNAYSVSWTASTDTWYHVAVVRSGNNLYFFVNGNQIGTTQDVTGDSCYNGTEPLIIGSTYKAAADDLLDGWMDEIRISKGIARWTSNFTPPSGSYSENAIVYNMSLQSELFSAESAPDDARIVILEEDVDSVTLNTDLKAWVSRDDGTTWTQGTLSDEGDFDSSKRVLTADFDISGQPSDTDMLYKLTVHNTKELKIHGTGLSWS